MKKKLFVALFVATIFMLSGVYSYAADDPKPTVYSHTIVTTSGIAFHHYTEPNSDETTTKYTEWKGPDGITHRVDYWTFHPPMPPRITSGDSTYSDDNVYIPNDNPGLLVTTTLTSLYLSGDAGSAKLVNIETGETILKHIIVSKELKKVELPEKFNFKSPYAIIFENDKEQTFTTTFYFTPEGYELQNK